jgi:RNA polymerase sigma factor (sigma-70 family)
MANRLEDVFRKLMLFSQPEQVPNAGLSAEVGSPVEAVQTAAREINQAIPPLPPRDAQGVGAFLQRRLNPRTAWWEITHAPEIGPMGFDMAKIGPMIEPIASKLANIAKRTYNVADQDAGDLVGEAAMGIMEALQKADPSALDDAVGFIHKAGQNRIVDYLRKKSIISKFEKQAGTQLGDEGDELTRTLENLADNAPTPEAETIFKQAPPAPTPLQQATDRLASAPVVEEEAATPIASGLAGLIDRIYDPVVRTAAKELLKFDKLGKSPIFSAASSAEKASLTKRVTESLKEISKTGYDPDELLFRAVRDLQKNYPIEHKVAQMVRLEGKSVKDAAAELQTTPEIIRRHLLKANMKIEEWTTKTANTGAWAIKHGVSPTKPTLESLESLIAKAAKRNPDATRRIVAEAHAQGGKDTQIANRIRHRLQKIVP